MRRATLFGLVLATLFVAGDVDAASWGELGSLPQRGTPSAWCTTEGCDMGFSGSLVRRQSRIFPGRWWTIEGFAGQETMGAGITWQALRGPADRDGSRLTLWAGACVAGEWGSGDLSPGLLLRVSW